MTEIIIEAILEGIAMEDAVEKDFMDWVDSIDADMEDADIWDFL